MIHKADETKAFQRYLKAAEQGNPEGQRRVGECYLYGTGVAEDEQNPLTGS